MIRRLRVNVRGIVQGVGFRPFVYRLAARYELSGWVLNDSNGVTIEAEGEDDRLERFLTELRLEAPCLSAITDIASETVEVVGDAGFVIRHSVKGAPVATLISPDIAICEECLSELRHPGDRRYRYPFINCTNCGPRYTIVENIPYDRPFTSMKHFTMCAPCAAEYGDPASRRFHAQPNACPDCGPRLALLESDGRPAPAGVDPLGEAVRLLKAGGILAVKGIGGFHLAVDAANDEAVRELRRRKHREEKPFAVMASSLEAAGRLVRLSASETAALASPARPILLAGKLERSPVAAAVAPGLGRLGIMLPYAPLHHLLFDDGGFIALVMTSANLSEEPLCIGNEEAVRRLAGIADAFLVHDRDIYLRTDDSVAAVFREELYPLRRSRGFVPAPVILGEQFGPVLGVGAELKNALCLLKGNLAFMSQHVGDLANEEAFSFFRLTADHLERILECRAGLLAHDLHPDYLATRWALADGRPAVAVQHHHAHAVSCMAEHRLRGPVLAVTFDGTGYGADGHVWGGEFLVADAGSYRRAAHLREVALIGGDAAVREPSRMALAYLHAGWGEAPPPEAAFFLESIPGERLRILRGMLEGGVNLHPTSSAGRLFDAVAALLGMRPTVSFEGQAAMELEHAADRAAASRYLFEIQERGDLLVAETLPIILGVLRERAAGVASAVIAGRFHHTLAALVAAVLERLRRREKIDDVVLSGGVFQNLLLLELTVRKLEKEGFRVHWHRKVPANDGGIALGQAVAAHAGRRPGSAVV